MLNIYYSRESVDKEKFIFDQIRKEPGGLHGGRVLVLVPDQYTLEAEQQAFHHLKTEGLLNVEILSMSRLGSRILDETGGGKQTFIDKYGRHMILARIAKEEKEKLQVFRGLETRNSFIEMVNNFISELKQNNCSGKDLEEMASKEELGAYTRKKLEDLSLLCRRYEEEICGKYTDSEDYIDLYLRKIGESDLIAGSKVWIYGFDSFAPKALDVIGQLMAHACEVNVVLTWEKDCRDEELFQLTGIVMENLESKANALGISSKYMPILKECYGFENKRPAMEHLERELYTLPSKKMESHEGIHLVSSANLYNEAESAAAWVLHLVREKGLRYRDIRLVCNDQNTRSAILQRVFQEYGIPLFWDTKKDILSSPIIQYVLSMLAFIADGYRTEDLFLVLKSGFGTLEREEIIDLENYAIKYRIRRTMWMRPFVKGNLEYGEDGLARLELLRQRAVEPAEKLAKIVNASLKQQGTVSEFIENFYAYLYETVKLPEAVLEYIEGQENLERYDLADEASQIWGCMIGILDQMMELMGEESFQLDTFLELFRVGLSQVEIGILPPTKDGLLMGTMQRTRMSNVKALLVVGANEGILPQENPEVGLFGTEEKELFREKGTQLCKVDSIMLMEERLAMYRNLSKPEHSLWMSCSLSNEEGKEIKPSSIFVKMKELFPNLEEEPDVLNREEKMPLVHGGISSLRHLTEALREATEGQPLAPEWEETLAWYRDNQREALEPLRKGIGFTNLQEKLGREAARNLFLRNPEKAISLSPSRLEKFSRCPFSHFVSYGLRPEERRIFEIAPREIGDIYHECLMVLAQTLTKDNLEVTHPLSPWMQITRRECRLLVEETVKQQMDGYREGVFLQGKEEAYRSGRLVDICEKVCWAVVEQVRAGQIERNGFEVGFRRGGEIKPICVELENETVYIEGKIDRVDYLPDDRVKIIDYKTGNEEFSIAEAKAGYRLQLMLYLEAACEEERKPAGVFYFRIKEPNLDATGKEWDAEEMEKEIRKNFKLNGVMVDEPGVIRNIAGDFTGYSEIVPLRAGKDKISGTGKENLISEEDFAELREVVAKKVKSICQELVDGTIEIHPMKTKDRSACTFCEYKGICRFDTVFDGCKYNVI